MNRLFLSLFAVALFVPFAHAGTYTAASCSQSNVNAVINGPTHTAVDGDVIHIPSGSCTWTSGISVPSNIGITIIGSGTPNSTPSTMAAAASCSNTTITDSITNGSALFSMAPTYGNATSRLSCMKLVPTAPNTGFGVPISTNGTCTSSGCPNFRVDNLTVAEAWADAGLTDNSFANVNNVFGVADHNTVGDLTTSSIGIDFMNPTYSAWNGVGQLGDNSWTSPDTLGTAQTFYLENNTFGWAYGTDTDSNLGGGGGGRFACRFNTFNSVTPAGACTNHGTETGGRWRGGRQAEFYGNTVVCDNTTVGGGGCSTALGLRSGVGISFGNTYSGAAWYNSYVSLSAYRSYASFPPWGYCDGQGPYDKNDGTVYASGTISSVSVVNGSLTITDGSKSWSVSQWIVSGAPYSIVDTTNGAGYEITESGTNSLTADAYSSDYWNGPPTFSAGDSYQILRATICIDQPSRSGGTLISGTTPTPTGWVGEVLDPFYEWNDGGKTPNYNNVTTGTQRLIANRDFYSDNSAGTPHAQTSPTSPFNGATGVGFGTLANRPTTCTTGVGYFATDQGNWNQSGNGFGQGQLYTCTATNTWTLHYTPYSYPHLLTRAIPLAPTNLRAIVH